MRCFRPGNVLAAAWGMLLAGGCRSLPQQDAVVDQGFLFEALDKNKDGRISPEELAALSQDSAAVNRLFKRLDQDRDGALSRAEFRPVGVVYKW